MGNLFGGWEHLSRIWTVLYINLTHFLFLLLSSFSLFPSFLGSTFFPSRNWQVFRFSLFFYSLCIIFYFFFNLLFWSLSLFDLYFYFVGLLHSYRVLRTQRKFLTLTLAFCEQEFLSYPDIHFSSGLWC